MENLSTLAIYSYEGESWERTSIANQAIEVQGDGMIVLRASTTHTAVYGAFFVTPTSLPDASHPLLSNAQISNDGAFWQESESLLEGATAYVRLSVEDRAEGVQQVSGLSTTTAPSAPSLIAGTKALLHFD
ncbi:MAG: hypothetical protein AAB037_03980, partial [Chloroflexota bacterium]